MDLTYDEAVTHGRLVGNQFCGMEPGTCDKATYFKVEGPIGLNDGDDLITVVFAYNQVKEDILLVSCWKSKEQQNCSPDCGYKSRF